MRKQKQRCVASLIWTCLKTQKTEDTCSLILRSNLVFSFSSQKRHITLICNILPSFKLRQYHAWLSELFLVRNK